MGRKHPFLSFMVIFPNLLPLISSQCTDYIESSQPTNVTLTSSPPVMMDGRLHYCNSNQHCSVTCTNRNDNEHGNTPYFHVDDRCLALSGISSEGGFSVLEEGIVNTTIRFLCSSVGAIRCTFGDEHFSSIIRITKDKECNNKSAVISTSQTDSPVLVPSRNVSTPSTAPTSTTITPDPIGPTKEDNSEPSVNIPLVVTLPIIALLSIVVAALILLIVIYKKCIKFSLRKICRVPLPTPARSEEDSTTDDVFGTLESSESLNLERRPNLSTGNQEQGLLASPVEEEHPPLGVSQRNEVPDGTDGDAELGLFRPVQATT